MYELIILAQLMRGVRHGYLIAKIINDIIGPYARISNGRLYPLLAKLELSGLIAVDVQAAPGQHGDRQLRRYRITEAGKRRFHEVMMDTTSNPGDYKDVFLQKIAYFDFLKPEERMRLIDHYINYCQAHVLHMTAEESDLWQAHKSWGDECYDPTYIESISYVMRHMIARWQLELDWAMQLRAQELARVQLSKDVSSSNDNWHENVHSNRNPNEN